MSATRDTGFLRNAIQVTNQGVTFVSGSTTLMSISSSGAVTTTGVISGSNALSASYSISGSYTVSSSYAFTASSATNAFNSISASYAYTASSATNATSASKAVSASYSDTASFSNNFTVLGNLTVYGTQSVQYITSSQLNISSNIITVNVGTPAIRFGGLSVYDSGSTAGATGSLFWDSQNNRWIYQQETGSTYSGGMLMSGPRNFGGLGNEEGTTNNSLMKGQGGDHITSSAIFEVSGSVTMGTALTNLHSITGSLNVTGSVTTNGGLIIAGSPTGYPLGELQFSLTGNNSYSGISTLGTGTTTLYFDHRATSNTGNFVFRNGTGAANTLLTIAGTGAATFSGSVTAAGGFILNTSQAVTPAGSIGFNSAQGLFIYTKTGTSYDFKVYNGVGSTFMQVPTGTQNVEFLGTVAFASNINVNGLATSANYKLGVTGAAFISGTNSKGVFITDAATYASIVGLNSAISAYNKLELRASGTDGQIMLHTTGNVSIGNPTDTGDQLYLAGNLKMTTNSRIDSNGGYLSINAATGGNVGVGVASPSYKFHMAGSQYYLQPTIGNTGYVSDGLWGSTATPSFMGAPGQAGGYAKYGATGMLLGYQDNGSGLYSPAYGFEVKSTDGRPVTGNVVKGIVMKDTDSNVLVFYVNNNGNVANANNSYGSTSDVSLKENIVDATPKLANLLQVKIRNYNLKADPNKLKQIGVVAQELEEVFPGMIETDTEGLKSVKYSVFVPMLVKAIQELKAENDSLKEILQRNNIN